jgi:orotidine-5'-phosphate decarboxylase
VYVVCRSSNPGAEDLQHLESGREPLFLHVAAMAQRANEHDNVGLVVGATAPAAIADVRRVSQLPFLVPGVGAQGGDIGASVRAAYNGDPASCLISSSRAILFDRSPARAAAAIQSEINSVVGQLR